MVNMLNKGRVRQLAGWALRRGSRVVLGNALRMGGSRAVDSAVSAAVDAVPHVAQRSYVQVFNVSPPVTVYVRGSHCRVTVRRSLVDKVTLEANLYRAFGVELAAEQDGAGVYIVAKRKPVVGTVARVDFTLSVPANTHLAFHLTPGDVVFESLEGLFEIPAAQVFADRDDAQS